LLYDTLSKEATVNFYILLLAILLFFGPIELTRRYVSVPLTQPQRRRLIWSCSVTQFIGLLTFLVACVSG